MPVDYVLAFEDSRATEASIAGGKGASLAKLTFAGFPVPHGAVVTADAYRAFIDEWPELSQLVAGLPVHEMDRPEALRQACTALRDALLARPFPATVENALNTTLAHIVEAGSVSVRSSATLEDLARAAFAGQHDSFLGVRGLVSTLAHVKRCWASLWEDRAVRYRHEKGFGLLDADMAVVVQRMIDADAAGVAFSIHPITGESDRILVSSAWGLGETVVSGEGEIDQWVLEKATGHAIESRIGSKKHAIRQAADGGTRRVTIEPARRDIPSLSVEQLAALADIVRRSERYYAFPQDLEWATADGRIHLLQSRPVTELPPRWTRQESAERFPSPLTPLTWDFTTPGFHESLAHSLRLMGLPPFEGEWFARLDGYIYGNQTAVEVFAAGHAAAFDSLEELEARLPELRVRYRWVQELPVQWARDLDHYLLELGRLSSRGLDALSLQDVWSHTLEIDRLGREYFLPNIAISITQGLLHRLLFQLVAHVVGREDAPAVYDGLTCHCETKTGLVNRDLHALANVARNDEGLRTRLLEGDRRALCESGALDLFPEFAARFRRFLALHGHREVEFDVYHPTWSGQPWVVLENLRLLLLQEAYEDPGAAEQALRSRQLRTEQGFLRQVPEALRPFAAEIVRLARAYTALDDLEHYQTTRLTPPFRAALVEIGRRLMERGVLAEPDDIFFLQRATLEAVIGGRITAAAARAEADANKQAYERQVRGTPAFRWGETDEAVETQGRLEGLAGAPGMAEAPACLVRSAEDFGRFKPGCVLVARTTNPAWTPLFYSAAAVVTESGGPLSHGAVTARELRIPAVMGVRGVMGVLVEGQHVRVDGTRGTVTVLDA